MLQPDRRKRIVNELKVNGIVKVDDLAELLSVSNMTIRRDLKELEENGLIKRTHGGATLVDSLTMELPFLSKEILNINEKKKIAKEAVKYIENGMVVGLDSGTTSMEIAKLISNNKTLTVITPDVIIASYLCQYSNMDVICTGGYVQSNTGVCLGQIAEGVLSKVRTDICFIATSAFTTDSITTPTFTKEAIKRLLIESSKEAVLIADSSKYGKEHFVKITELSKFNLMIVDDGLSKEVYEVLKEKLEIKLV